MKERPILFSSEMVRAILDGRKTQTRRVIKLRDFRPCDNVPHSDWYFRAKNGIWSDVSTARLLEKYCSYGQPGDRLWVRETFCVAPAIDGKPSLYFRADGPSAENGFELGYLSMTWKPSIFMPRGYSRLTLEVVNIRVQRVQEIGEDDAEKEGILQWEGFFKDYSFSHSEAMWLRDPIDSYSALWDSLNAKRGYSWESNPWVWVIEFKREQS